MGKVRKDYDAIARAMVENVGGPDNIESYRHCITRVRFRLKDESVANDDAIKATPGVVDVIKSGGEYMVVIGTDVEDAYDAVVRLLGEKDAPSSGGDAKGGNPLLHALNVIVGSIQPAVNMLCAGGILKGLLSIASMAGLIASGDGLYTVLNATGDAAFYFLPVIIGYNFCKQMGVDAFLGILIGGILVYPGITGFELTLFGFTSTTTYSASVIPTVLICSLAVPIFRFLKAHMSRNVSGFLVPAVTLLIVMPLGVAFIGPFAAWLSSLVNDFITMLMTAVPLVGGAVFGALYQVLVIFGLHQAVTNLAFVNLLSGNPDPIMAICCLCSFSQIGVVLAIYLRTKSARLKEVAMPAFISGVFGVTEPAIYGVTLPRVKYFVVSCVGAAVMGALLMVTGTLMYTFSGLGVFSIIGFVDPANPAGSLTMTLIATAVAFALSFVVTFLMFRDEGDDLADAQGEKDVTPAGPTVIHVPVKGQILDLSQVPDPAFSSGAMGHGFAVDPVEGVVRAPFDGVANVVFPTGHALGLTSDTGVELLIHVGMDTVNLQGRHFTSHVTQGQRVKEGDVLVEFDLDDIRSEGYSAIVPVIVTNEDDLGGARVDLEAGTITVGE